MKQGIKNQSSQLVLLVIMLITMTLPVNRTFANLKNGVHPNIAYIGGAYVVFAGKSGGDIKRSEIVGQTEVRVAGCAKGYAITSFTLEITRGQTKSTYPSSSNQLSKEMQSKLQSLVKGDSFEFKLMKARQEGTHMVDVHGSKFTIV
jgi:hypothetical protein